MNYRRILFWLALTVGVVAALLALDVWYFTAVSPTHTAEILSPAPGDTVGHAFTVSGVADPTSFTDDTVTIEVAPNAELPTSDPNTVDGEVADSFLWIGTASKGAYAGNDNSSFTASVDVGDYRGPAFLFVNAYRDNASAAAIPIPITIQ